MIRTVMFLALAGVVLSLCSCGKTSASGQHATIQMKDGTEVTGILLSTSANEIQIAGDDKVTKTVPMPQVRSIEYMDAPPAPAASAPVAAVPEDGSSRLHQRDHFHPNESAITTTTRLLPVGTVVTVRNEETIDSGKAVEGQIFPAEIVRDVLDEGGKIVIPRGANAQIIIRSASKGGKIRGAADLVLDLAFVSIDGRRYEISTVDLAERGRQGVGANRRTAEYTGGGAAIGAVIGAIAGGGKGAAIGAGSGAGAGALTQILTKGTIKVPVESLLTFKLDRPLRVESLQ